MSRSQRFLASQLVWLFTGMVIFLWSDFFRSPSSNIFILIAVFAIALTINLGIWFSEDIARTFGYENESETDSIEKRKRKQSDNVLHDLSEDDLLTLRQHLQDNALYDHINDDDGELIQRN